jgi:dTDP-4-dehydrorhamnose reductase
MRILVLGGNGLIGGEFVRLCRVAGHDCQATCHARPTPGLIPFDVCDLVALSRLLDRLSPRMLVNAVGLAGGVDFCERNPGVGRRIHVEATRVMVDWCEANDAALLHVSTDYVFDDSRPLFGEADEPRPLNCYGRLKLEGERLIQMRLKRRVIARTTSVYGWDPQTATPNFLMGTARALRERGLARVPAYLTATPTRAADLAAAMLDLAGHGAFGLYHIVGPERLSRLAWAVKLAQAIGYGPASIQAIPVPPAGAVPRPFHAGLATDKLRSASAVPLVGVDEGLQWFVAEMNAAGWSA